MSKFQNLKIFIILCLVVFAIAVPAQAQVIGNLEFLKGIVPCGTSYTGNTPCTVCHFYKLLQNIINFMLYVTASLVTLMATYIAFLFLFSGGSPSKITDAKSKLWLLVWGIIVVLGSWLLINTILNFVVNPQVFPMPWSQIQCEIAVAPSPPPPSPSPSEEQALAQIISNQKTCGGSSSCGGVNACSTIQAVANGQPSPVCSSGCTTNTSCTPNPNVHLSRDMLTTLDAMYLEGLRYKSTSLTTGSHGPNSFHYQGRAVDLVSDGSTTYSQLEQRLKSSSATFIQCENSSGAKVSCTSSSTRHIHAEFR
ncbi:MAG: hypothetical protein Q7K16_00935 [Candidatus Azambacteria bacterium]|nr:hypothetical protein [Candidatus Azambacteria bacterium]